MFYMGRHIDGTGAEKEGDFGEGVVDNMDQSAFNSGGGQKSHT